jgi:glycosyltransferase involved in cell wall biosynthesis
MAGETVKFVQANDAEIIEYFRSAAGFIFPGLDDFGIVAVEAMAAGVPLIAYGAGGALDFVTPETGVMFKAQTIEALVAALSHFQTLTFDHKVISSTSKRFSSHYFRTNMQDFIAKHPPEQTKI